MSDIVASMCHCFRPVVDEEKLSNLNELPEDEFRPAFLEEVHRFVKCALASSPVKVVNQVEITGHRKYSSVSCSLSKRPGPLVMYTTRDKPVLL